MKIKPISSVETAIRIYYTYPEIGNEQMRELFGGLGNSTAAKYKRPVRDIQIERKIPTMSVATVNTKVAYEVWGIDIEDLVERRRMLKKLGMTA